LRVDRIIFRLDELLSILDDPKAAYVVRSRLDRVSLMLQRYVKEAQAQNTEFASRVESATLGIQDSFRALRRRSEPFGEAWIEKLGATRSELLLLRDELAK
jgi:hypothetical protein